MPTTDPFTLGLGPSSPGAKGERHSAEPEGESSARHPPPDQSTVDRADRLAAALRGGAGDAVSAPDAGLASAEVARRQDAVSPGAVCRPLPVPEGAVAGAGGVPFTDFEAAQFKAAHLSAETGDTWWVRALSSSQFVLVCRAAGPPASVSGVGSGNALDMGDDPASQEDFRTKDLDDLQLSDFPDGHPVHRFGLSQYKRFAKRDFKFKPAYRSMWPLFLVAAIGGIVYGFPMSVITLLPDDALHQLLTSFDQSALLSGVETLGMVIAAVGLGKVIFERHYRRYFLMPGSVKAEEGIIARKSTKIAYLNVVNYDVQQSPIARILNYGTLELSSAGSDGSEINMRNLFSPRVVELVLESRMEEARQAGRSKR